MWSPIIAEAGAPPKLVRPGDTVPAASRAATIEAFWKNRAPFVTNGDRSTDETTLERYPHAALPATMSLRRVVATLVPSLQQQGYFQQLSAAEPVKIGLLYNEDPDFAKVPGDAARMAATLFR